MINRFRSLVICTHLTWTVLATNGCWELPEPDDRPLPAVVSHTPADGSGPLPLSTVVEISFSQAMGQAAVESALTVEDRGSINVQGTIEWNSAGDRLTFTPDELLTDDEEFTVRLGSEATNIIGMPLARPLEFSFTSVDLWTDSIHYGAEEAADGIALDDEGNVYVTGSVQVEGENRNVWARKYNPLGEPIWTNTHNGPADGFDDGIAITADESGNAYVGGNEQGIGELWNVWIRKYDPTGEEAWTFTYDGALSSNDRAYGLAVDEQGQLYATGTEGTTGANSGWVRKLDAAGEEIWIDTIETTAGVAIVLDEDKNVYVGGYQYLPDDREDVWLRNYDRDGEEQWTWVAAEPPTESTHILGLDRDDGGNLYVAGTSDSPDREPDIWLRKYNGDGGVAWTKTYDGPVGGHDEARSLVLGTSGKVYACGRVSTPSAGWDAWMAVYDTDGELLQQWFHNGSANGDDWCFGIAVDPQGNVFVAGVETIPGEGQNIWVRKYDANGNGV